MKSKTELLKIISMIEKTPLKSGGHGYSEYGNITIGDASKISSNSYCDENEPVAFVLIEVILSARANYERTVVPRMKKVRQIQVSKNDSINWLEANLNSFDSYYKLCRINSSNKYNTLRNLVEAYKNMKLKNLSLSEYEIFNKWANEATINGKEQDIIGSIPRIGIATYQHLRMNFGANTIKPDQRVCEVLEREFGYKKINQVNAIEIVEKISEITGYSALLLDQIMVKYGSSIYNLT